jgi:hypothetical protein
MELFIDREFHRPIPPLSTWDREQIKFDYPPKLLEEIEHEVGVRLVRNVVSHFAEVNFIRARACGWIVAQARVGGRE